ncbi:MAG: DNA polymerase I [Gammaproteobacteria bacterium]|nr:DNA polymerase I [Gammaproteobacteria bacterium]NIR83359.1 DNA polymerase I [Gammaproteobacteria bacterium]NIR91159.1 DNA polymerase I [Gammaproteobacteria bacterium]NIU04526.1 DNA polymerase I [Gammaproteobacteria bacterium]NIW87162.1 DNA polymerase I [Gammaproteobacteria bacterium]
MPEDKPLILVDGSSFFYRAFHAMPPLTNSRGEPTGAVYGMTNMLRKLLSDYDSDEVAVVFDAEGKTFRDDLYEDYKANRPPMPDELVQQIEPLHAVIRALGLPLLEVRGVEADDVIGTLARRAARRGRRVLIATGDKDMAQLVDARVALVNTMDGAVLDPDGVRAKFGIPPDRIVDYLALVGDTTDNVPGVQRVGPKTAVKWLNEFGSLEGVMAHADEIKGKVGESLRETLDKLPLWRELVTIEADVSLDVELSELRRRPPNNEALRELYADLEFKAWLGEVLEQLQREAAARATYDTVLDPERFEAWLARLEGAELFAVDLETTSLDYMSGDVVGISFAVEPGEAAYVPVAHRYPGAPAQLDRGEVLERLRPLLEDPARAKLGHNLKYDMSVLARYGIELRGVRFDTMLESYVLDSTATRHDMDSLSLKYLSHRTIRYEEVAGKGARQVSFDQVRLEEAGPYAAEDADVTLKLHHALWPRLAKAPRLQRLFDEIEMPLVPVLSRMERNGVRVDIELLERQGEELATRIREVEAQAFELAGAPFNLGSPKQIQELLFERLGLPARSRTPKGQPSTAESVLQDLAFEYPLPKLILEHRALTKLKSTYVDALPVRVNAHTGRVHTSYHQAITSTGRLSSSEPNLQNIPVRTAEGRRIRQAFVAAPGYKLLAADYSQIELRIMAHLSGDSGLRSAFAEGRDIHQATAAEVFGTPLEAVTSDQRRRAKAINFGLIYGMSAFGLARQLGIEREEAELYMNRYFERYPGVKAYMAEARAGAHHVGYVETVYGRRLYLPEINSRNHQRRQYAERTAINAPMQGSAADIIKRAMVQLDEWITGSGLDVRMIMQVHDELVFEVPQDAIEELESPIARRMSGAADLSVPLVVEIGIGDNWDEAH